jgi:hypothetical protein
MGDIISQAGRGELDQGLTVYLPGLKSHFKSLLKA